MEIVHRIHLPQRQAGQAIFCAALFVFASSRAGAQAAAGPIHPSTKQQAPADEPQETQAPQRMRPKGLGSWPSTPVELTKLKQDLTRDLNVRFTGWRDSSGAARKPRIVVLDFCSSDGRWMQFGAWLADQVSAALTKDSGTFEVIERVQHASLGQSAIKADICEKGWDAAQSVGADFYLKATFIALDQDLGMTIQVARAVAERLHRPIYFVKSRVAISNEMDAHLGMSFDSLRPVRDAYSPGVNGVSLPKCLQCPAPPFSPETRGKKISGHVGLLVLIMGDGSVGDVQLKKSLEPSLDQQAMETVKTWRFEPARDPNGVPISVHQFVDITFRSD